MSTEGDTRAFDRSRCPALQVCDWCQLGIGEGPCYGVPVSGREEARSPVCECQHPREWHLRCEGKCWNGVVLCPCERYRPRPGGAALLPAGGTLSEPGATGATAVPGSLGVGVAPEAAEQEEAPAQNAGADLGELLAERQKFKYAAGDEPLPDPYGGRSPCFAMCGAPICRDHGCIRVYKSPATAPRSGAPSPGFPTDTRTQDDADTVRDLIAAFGDPFSYHEATRLRLEANAALARLVAVAAAATNERTSDWAAKVLREREEAVAERDAAVAEHLRAGAEWLATLNQETRAKQDARDERDAAVAALTRIAEPQAWTIGDPAPFEIARAALAAVSRGETGTTQ